MKKKLFLIFFVIISIFNFSFISAENIEDNIKENIEKEKVIINFFDDRLCSTCKSTKDFIEDIANNYSYVELNIYPITDTQKLNNFLEEYNIQNYRLMAPTVFINGKLFQFNEFTEVEKNIVINAIEGKIIEDNSFLVKIPFLNINLNLSNLSLPFFTIILGFLDGVNICSLGALVLILSIVLVFNSRKKVFLFGGVFILASTLIYGILVFVWGKIFEAMIGHLEVLRIIIGLSALFGGLYFLRQSWRFFKHGPTCDFSDSKIINSATNRLKKAFESKKGTLFLILSITFFAFVITLVELPCSIGLPIAFTGILIDNNLNIFWYTFYILVYLLFYMLDEIIIFTIAVFTKKIWLTESKAITWFTFLGAIVLLYLAFYYLF